MFIISAFKKGWKKAKERFHNRLSKPRKDCYLISVGNNPLTEDEKKQFAYYLPKFMKTGLCPLYNEAKGQILLWEPFPEKTGSIVARMVHILEHDIFINNIRLRHTYLWELASGQWEELSETRYPIK